MAINQVKLTAAMNNNLFALQNTQKLMDVTQERLATGLKVNSAMDNPSAFYAAQSLNQRAGDLDSLLDSMGQAIQTLKAADEGITAATKFVEQAKAIAEQAAGLDETIDAAEITKLGVKYGEVLDQLNALIKDSGYKGVNLLNEQNLTVYFAEGDRTNASKIELVGVDATTTGLNFTDGAGATFTDSTATPIDWSTTANVNESLNDTIAAIENLRQISAGFSTDYNIVQNREDFTDSLVNVLTEGADKLTLADMNEESANMLALQTRQQLGVNSLSLASQAQQSVLKLFG